MSPSRISAALPAVVLLALLAACSPSPATPGASQSNGDNSSASNEFADLSNYYPVGEGNVWVYTMTYPDPIGVVTETETMTTVVSDGAGGATATITRDFHYENGSTKDFSDEVTYVFHADGSIEVPFQTLPNSDTGAVVTVHEGTMVWPNDEQFAAGTPTSGDITASVESSGMTINEKVHFEINGAGEEEVTVPFGTVTARQLVQKLTVNIEEFGIELPISATSWLAADVGLVRTEVPNVLGDGAPITVELVSFTPGG